MIEKLFRLGACLRFAAQANPFLNRAINYPFFWRGFEDLIERRIDRRLIDLFQPKIALQSLSSNWPLLNPQRGVAMRKPCIIEIPIFAQAFDNRLDNGFSRAATFEQTLS